MKRIRLTPSDRYAIAWFLQHSPSISCAIGSAGMFTTQTDPERGITDALLRDTERERGIRELLGRMRPRRRATVLMAFCGPVPPMLGAWRDLAAVVPYTRLALEFADGEGAKTKRTAKLALQGLSARALASSGDDPVADRLWVTRIQLAAESLVSEAVEEWEFYRDEYSAKNFSPKRPKRSA